jgi:hypothetical protein
LGDETLVQETIVVVSLCAWGVHNQHLCWCYGQLNATLGASGAGWFVAVLVGESDVRSNIHYSRSHRHTDSDACNRFQGLRAVHTVMDTPLYHWAEILAERAVVVR